jgi:hypothetical protein
MVAKREIFEHGHFDGVSNGGWVVGHFIAAERVRHSADVEVKWASHAPGPAGKGWSNCKTATTLSVLIRGRWRIEFKGAPDDAVELNEPGDYVIFRPGISHRAFAVEDSLFLTVRWPSVERDCRPIEA